MDTQAQAQWRDATLSHIEEEDGQRHVCANFAYHVIGENTFDHAILTMAQVRLLEENLTRRDRIISWLYSLMDARDGVSPVPRGEIDLRAMDVQVDVNSLTSTLGADPTATIRCNGREFSASLELAAA